MDIKPLHRNLLLASRTSTLKLTMMLAIGLCLLLGGCEPAEEKTAATPLSPPTQSPHTNTKVLWQRLIEQSQQARLAAIDLQAHLQRLKLSSSADNLLAAQQAWHQAHLNVQALNSVFTLSRVNPGLFPSLGNSFLNIDAWPITPGYLDSFSVYTHSGIVNDTTAPITAHNIRLQHGFTNNQDVSIGLHAMAYLLWGEHQKRTAKHFSIAPTLTQEQQQSELSIVDTHPHRRITLLNLQAQLLVDDLSQLHTQLQSHHQGFALTYFTLSPAVQVELWQQVFSEQLKHVAAQLENIDADISHSRFSGHQGDVMAAELLNVSQLLLMHLEPEEPSLLQLLAHDADHTALLNALSEVITHLQEWDEPWSDISPSNKRALAEQLRGIETHINPLGTE